MVHGHYSVLVDYAAKRFVSDEQRREYRQEALERAGQVLELKRAIAEFKVVVKNRDMVIDQLTEDNFRLGSELEDANERIGKLRPWATIGKVGVVVGSFAVVGIVTAQVLNSAK